MALEKCKECKTKVSDQAEVCPNCGIPAPTTEYTKNHPKCVIEGCYNYANTLSEKKYQGMCTEHYSEDLDKSSNMVWIVFIVIVLGLGMLF